jgi:hypothetical protein
MILSKAGPNHELNLRTLGKIFIISIICLNVRVNIRSADKSHRRIRHQGYSSAHSLYEVNEKGEFMVLTSKIAKHDSEAL